MHNSTVASTASSTVAKTSCNSNSSSCRAANSFSDNIATLLLNVTLPLDVVLTERDICDLEMLLNGSFSPLEGFHCFSDFCSVVESSRLCSGAVWPIPIVLPVPRSQIKDSTVAGAVQQYSSVTENTVPKSAVPAGGNRTMKLRDSYGQILAELLVEDCYVPHMETVCEKVLKTTDPNHPYVAYMQRHHSNCAYVGGKVSLVHPIIHFDFMEFRRSPAEIQQEIRNRELEVIVGFQTRNPMHRSHFELTVQALQEANKSCSSTRKQAHLLLSPVCGPTQPGDIKYSTRVRCYKKILPHYAARGFPDPILTLLPLAMRMAGPREALWHALIRKNFGCTHFIVGRDHAGPSSRRQNGEPFYGAYDSHEYVKSFQKEIGITPIFGKNMIFTGEKHGVFVQEGTVLPPGTVPKEISGTRLRAMLENREEVPVWFSFNSVVEELQKVYRKRTEQGFCIYFTGLPCSGKSTLASAVEAALQESEEETRQITVLDADIIRTHLSKGLGFSRDDRQCNVRRIGYVASVVVKHSGICIVANIAPYDEDRMFNRRLVEEAGGGYIEVYVSTPLQVCERRDVKDMYKKARAGVIKQFTGVSDPYEIPSKSELQIDSSSDVHGKVRQMIVYLETAGWIKRNQESDRLLN